MSLARHTEVGWVTRLTLAGDLVVVPVVRSNGSSSWEEAGAGDFRGPGYTSDRAMVIHEHTVCATQAEALNRAREAVGMARIDRPNFIAKEALDQQARRELVERFEREVKDELRERLRPVVEERLLFQAERAAFAREKEKERQTMARAEMQSVTEGKEITLLDKAKDAGTRAAVTLKADARRAAVRSFGRKMVAGAQAGAVRFLSEKGVSAEARQPIVEFLDSTAGKGVVGYSLGTFGPLIPGLAGRPVVLEACEELRTEALSLGLDALLTGLLEYLLPDIFSSITALEKAVESAPEKETP